MSLRRGLAALMLACAAVVAAPVQAQAQVGPTYEVRRGDTLFAIARKTKHDGVSRNQMILAIWRANRNAFPDGNIHMLDVGTVLVIPARETVAAVASVDADLLVRDMLAKPAPTPELPVARPAAPPQGRRATSSGSGGSGPALPKRAGDGTQRR